jgi:protein tyrosine/serine phosphatase
MIKILSLLLILSSSAVAAEYVRPIQWATPIQMPGVGNFYKITNYLYRSAHPSAKGMINLKKMGIKTIINLRAFYSDSVEIKGTGLLNEELSVRAWYIVDEDVIRVLRIMRKRGNGPFLIHCQNGADRTGLMCAMFRIVEQGWSKDEAIQEMVKGGYGFHAVWKNIINYVKNVDVDRIREEAAK